MFLSVVPLLLVSAHERGFWITMESIAMLYVIICLLAFAVDRSGMKRQRRDLAVIWLELAGSTREGMKT